MTVFAQGAWDSSETLAAGERVIRWGNGPVAFELRSPDSDIIEAAERVFGRWTPRADAQVHGRWRAQWSEDAILLDPRHESDDGSALPPLLGAAHAVAEVEYAAMWRIVDSCNHLLCFHSALLSKNGKSVAIVGPSHAGKSTLATGLWQRGWRFHCDDLTMIVDGKALAGPRRVALRSECRTHVGDELWARVPKSDAYFKSMAGCLFQPMHIDDTFPESVDLSAMIFLKRNGAVTDGPPRRLVSAHAAVALLPYTNIVRTRQFSSALVPVADLMAGLPAWDLPRAPLSEMISSVEHIAFGTDGSAAG